MSIARSVTQRFRSLRSSVFETDKPTSRKEPIRPNISLPLERPADFVDRRQGPEALPTHAAQEFITSPGSKPVLPSPPMSPAYSITFSSSSSYLSSRAMSRASSATPRTSYDSCDSGDSYFGSVRTSGGKNVSFSPEGKVVRRRKRRSAASCASSCYEEEGVLPPPIEDDKYIQSRIGKNRFAAAEYIREIEGTPMILVDGKLYL